MINFSNSSLSDAYVLIIFLVILVCWGVYGIMILLNKLFPKKFAKLHKKIRAMSLQSIIEKIGM